MTTLDIVRNAGALSWVAMCAGLMGAVPPHLTAAQRGDAVRLYVLDGGTLTIGDPTVFGLTRDDVPDLTTMPVPAFLVVHPKGALLWDTGLGDQLIGGSSSETQRGTMRQLVTQPLKGQLAAIGYPPEKINYLGLSHMHFDHVGNANDFAGPATTWLVQKVERDAMFGDNVTPQAINPDYAALKNANTRLLNGDHDVFGDGTVVIKATPGHTVGHQVLFLKLPKTGPIVLSGDLYHYPAERTLGRMPDREKTAGTAESRARVEALLKETGAQLWVGHDIVGFAKLKKSPEYYD